MACGHSRRGNSRTGAWITAHGPVAGHAAKHSSSTDLLGLLSVDSMVWHVACGAPHVTPRSQALMAPFRVRYRGPQAHCVPLLQGSLPWRGPSRQIQPRCIGRSTRSPGRYQLLPPLTGLPQTWPPAHCGFVVPTTRAGGGRVGVAAMVSAAASECCSWRI